MTAEERLEVLKRIRDILLENGSTGENLDRICNQIDVELAKLI
jgi:hypothetical protein